MSDTEFHSSISHIFVDLACDGNNSSGYQTSAGCLSF